MIDNCLGEMSKCVKKSTSDNKFNVPIESFDGAEIYIIIGILLLHIINTLVEPNDYGI